MAESFETAVDYPRMPSRPLIVRLRNWIGDVILGLPALRLLRSHGYELQLVGRGWAPGLLAGERWPVHVQPAALGSRLMQLRALKRQAAAADPGFGRRDNAIVLPTSFSGALEMRLAGLNAVGYRHEARSWLLSRSFELPAQGHELERYWRLACRFLGVDDAAAPPARIDLPIAPADAQHAGELVLERGLSGGFVLVCPFAGGQVLKQDKKWPAFADFARALLDRGHRVVACPGPGEERELDGWDARLVVLRGIRLGVYGALLREARVVVSNDTGPAHLAAAVGAPLVSVLGPTPAEQWRPWGPRVAIVQRASGWPSVDEVMACMLSHAGAA